MPKKYISNLTTEELKKAYIDEGRTLKEMCVLLGIKNTITAAKVMKEHGISTNHNKRISDKSKNGMTDEKFKEYLVSAYASGKSMEVIAKEVGLSTSGVRKYFLKYGIDRRSHTEFTKDPESNPNWHGGKRLKKSGYVEIYCPDHPNANKRKCVYEHQLVMEKIIGRHLKSGEVVHHIDGNKSNNNPSNLMLLTNEEHAKLHAALKKEVV